MRRGRQSGDEEPGGPETAQAPSKSALTPTGEHSADACATPGDETQERQLERPQASKSGRTVDTEMHEPSVECMAGFRGAVAVDIDPGIGDRQADEPLGNAYV